MTVNLAFHPLQDIDFLQFAFRWVNCLLLREFPFSLIPRLWVGSFIAQSRNVHFKARPDNSLIFHKHDVLLRNSQLRSNAICRMSHLTQTSI